MNSTVSRSSAAAVPFNRGAVDGQPGIGQVPPRVLRREGPAATFPIRAAAWCSSDSVAPEVSSSAASSGTSGASLAIAATTGASSSEPGRS